MSDITERLAKALEAVLAADSDLQYHGSDNGGRDCATCAAVDEAKAALAAYRKEQHNG